MNTGTGQKRKRAAVSFKREWLDEIVETESTQSHGTVRLKLAEIFSFDEDDGVVCMLCRDAKALGDFSTGKHWETTWKLDFLKRHLSSKMHLSSIHTLRNKNPSIRGSLLHMMFESQAEKEKRQTVLERQRSNPAEIKVLIDSVILAVKMNYSLNSVQEINEHMSKYIALPESWRSKNYAFEFLESINSVIQHDMLREIASARFHTLVVDESTDISVSKHLILYFKYRPINSSAYKISFGGIIQLSACDAAAIFSAIKQFYKKHNVNLIKMVMFTSDGASVMTGKVNGVAAQLKKIIPHLVNQHCVLHREDLGISSAWKEVKFIREIETLMRTVYTVFCRSATKKCKFQEIAAALECDSIAFRPLNEVRWLSRHFALQAIICNYEPLLIYFHESKDVDPISKYCYKKLADNTYRISLHILNDVLSELASLCMRLQTSGLTSLDAFHHAHGKINKIREQYLSDVISWSDKVRTLLQENTNVDTSSILAFIRILCDHLEDRFPENEVNAWSAFDCTAIAQCKFQFGIDEINSLCLKYKNLLIESTQNSIIDQYNDYKYAVAGKIKSNLILSFEDMVHFALNSEQFQELAILLDIGGTFLASSADCERGFSLMNALKSKIRNRLEENHLDMLLRIKNYLAGGGFIDLDRVYTEWTSCKDRREKL